MNASATAHRILDWAIDPVGAPPTGPLLDVAALAEPSLHLLAALGMLAQASAARSHAGAPPLGDGGPVGLGTVLIAAAAGGRMQRGVAERILGAVPPMRAVPSDWAEAVVRHGLCGTLLRAAGWPGGADDQLVAASPLTAVLHRPVTGQGTAVLPAVSALLRRPRGDSVLVAALCEPSADAAVLIWRSAVLEHLRGEHLELLLDVYTTARLRHGELWDARIAWAAKNLRRAGLPDDTALATLRYWAPLARVHRDQRPQTLAGRIVAGTLRAADPIPRPRPDRSTDQITGRVYLRPADYMTVLRLVERYGLLPVEDLL
ncbi:hypothetical protein ACFQZ4_43650 [Catellatospora coxensis]|uniref:FtsH ternary system domain-containing protein n=1 Tax=Catellatospora coxensis TaxID=310354 RepID=A0A8J3LAB4_9ACTN|nr:hypothetical protein [Catellatospora coxensis]GIG10930.1 hypothetical protein Cco03nite_76300 [Catellatospora coxensis]